ncbi:MAG: PA2779 family protein [Burkholderiales bacterium]
MNAFNRVVARLLILCTLGLGLPLPASAGIVTTDQITASAERDRVRDFMVREDVRAQMESLGVDANSVRDRVDAMTDEEVGKLAGRIDQMPAGGGIIGVLFAVFIILLVTDILGLTKVFPFTRSVR